MGPVGQPPRRPAPAPGSAFPLSCPWLCASLPFILSLERLALLADLLPENPRGLLKEVLLVQGLLTPGAALCLSPQGSPRAHLCIVCSEHLSLLDTVTGSLPPSLSGHWGQPWVLCL